MPDTRRRIVATGAAIAAMMAVGLPAATAPAQAAAWPICYYSVNADNTPVYIDRYPPPQLPIIYRMDQGDTFANPSARRYTAPDGTVWRSGYDDNVSGAAYGWVKRSDLTFIGGTGFCT